MSYSSEDWQDIISNSSSRETVSSVRSLTADPSSEASLQIQEYTDSKVPDHGESIVKSVFPMEKWLPTVKAWRTLTSFASILKQIPSRLVLESNEYRLEGYPTNLEWKKLQAYATTIKELSISDDDPKIPKVADSVYFLLGQCQGTVEPLFPSLSRLRIASTVPTSLPHIFLFFSPALKRVELMGLTDDARAALAIFLRRVGKETSLSHLILESTVSVPEIVKLLVNCRSLEALELRNTKEEWNISSLNSLSHLPKLKCLKLDATTVVNDSYRSADMATPEGQNMLFLNRGLQFHWKTFYINKHGLRPDTDVISEELIR
ncbi:hypothetical protein CPB84DRAFT_535100 [Gymnopilus junonius]|uniref:Uncharacterized protein n=1 Tax=Gymnopilus junonius TaxID=109634 RepID=A0A9P5TQ28_GYMJU|nr:hypothetical protein CPB84DRAFT_535100 [Gymnopilus junonius]